MGKQEKWKLFKGSWISTEPVLPGVWQRKEGGHVVRARAKEGTTGRQREIWKTLPTADAATALKWLKDERAKVRAGLASAAPESVRFSEFAGSLFEHKVTVGDIKSARGRDKWRVVLEQLGRGTKGKSSGLFVQGFGDMFVDKIHVTHVDTWTEGMARLVAAGDYAPTTVNGWLSILRVVMKAARRKLSLPYLATEGAENLDLSEHATYTEEEPNALLPEEVAPFMSKFKELHAQHFAMTYLGLITGLRPSSLRPLRRRGSEIDVLWDKNRILVRRSQTLGDEVMLTTKQRRRYAVDLPQEAMDVLRWHVDTQLRTPEQQDSDLLFPAVNGKFRSPSVLNKPLAEVATELELGKQVTQRALRRTFNDLARAAQVSDLVTRSISGHLTERMQQHYSTVNAAEQRDALAKVIRLFDPKVPATCAPGGEGSGEGPRPSGEGTKKAG
jgi:integrase